MIDKIKYAYIGEFEEGFACVEFHDGKWGHIDEEGNELPGRYRNV